MRKPTPRPVRQQLAELRTKKPVQPGPKLPEAEVKKRNPQQRSELQQIASKATFLKRRVLASFAALRDAAKYAGMGTTVFQSITDLEEELEGALDDTTERLRSEAVRRQIAAGAKVVTTRKPRSRRA
jgi:hypothetical protein